MSTAAARGRLRALLRNPFRSWTLRRRLVVASVALLAVLGVAIGLISALFMGRFLVQQLDQQLDSASGRAQFFASRSLANSSILPDPTALLRSTAQGPGAFAAYLAGGAVEGQPAFIQQTGDTQQPSVAHNWQSKLAALPVDHGAHTVNLGGTLGPYRMQAVSLPDGSELVLGLPLANVDAATGRFVATTLLVTLAAVALAALVATLIVRLALRPLDRVTATATEVSELPLDRGEVALAARVPENGIDPRTEVGRLAAATNRMLQHVASALAARQSSENKVRQFVADASHELRTPLASIRGYAELTRRAHDDLPEDVVRSIGRVESEAQRMTGLVEDLLLLARLDEGRALGRDEVDLSRLVIDSISDAHAAGPDHRWGVDLPGEPVVVIGDGPRLHQVIVNLLANARVHTPAGSTVTLALSRAGTDAVLTVTDDGPGIAPEVADTLFERFARGDSSRSRETGSTGLGLAIVQAVVTAHGGTVSVLSTPGATTFRVVLPALDAPASPPAPAQGWAPAASQPAQPGPAQQASPAAAPPAAPTR